MQIRRMALAALLGVVLAAGAAHAQAGWGGDADRRDSGGRRGPWDRGGSQLPSRSVIDGPITPADLMALLPLTPEQQRLYVAAYDSMMDATHVQRDTLHAYMAAHRPARPGRPGEPGQTSDAADAEGKDADDGDVQGDAPPPPPQGGIPSAGSVDDPRRLERLAFEQTVLHLAEPLQQAQDDFEKLMPRLLTKAQMKTYAKWFEERNQVKRQYPRWLGHSDPDASGETYGR